MFLSVSGLNKLNPVRKHRRVGCSKLKITPMWDGSIELKSKMHMGLFKIFIMSFDSNKYFIKTLSEN